MDGKELTKEFEDLKFAFTRSQIYYEKRATFWSAVSVTSQVAELLLSSSAFVAAVSGFPSVIAAVTLVSSLIGVLALAFKSTSRMRRCFAQRNAFSDLMKMLPVDPADGTKELLREIRDKRLDVEKNDDPILECLDAICHNKACISIGLEPEARLSWFESWFGRFLPIPYSPKRV